MVKNQKYPPAKVIAIDVDGTLMVRGEINAPLCGWIKEKKRKGFHVILWSARGMRHAQGVARKAGMDEVFDTIIGKPGYIVDDRGWGWVKFTRVLRNWRDW